MPRTDGSLTPGEVRDKHAKSFRAFYEAYPKHVAPNEAQRVFADLVEFQGLDPVRLIESAKAYALNCGDDLKYVPAPHSWLKQGRYDDADLFVDERASERNWLLKQWSTGNVTAVQNKYGVTMPKQYPPEGTDPAGIEFWYFTACQAWITSIAKERLECQNQPTTSEPSSQSSDPSSSTPSASVT